MAARLSGLRAGTGVLTPDGYRPVESLRTGDLVGALIGRGPIFVPITWVGRRSEPAVSGNQAAPAVPVRIRRNAINDRMPSRDLLLAPDHAIYIEGHLYLVGQLVNDRTILFDHRVRKADYWGIQLERHDLLLADNLPVESLLPANASAFTEVKVPHLSVVGSKADQVESAAGASPLDFPASIQMSVRWFRRRLLTRANQPPVAPVLGPPPPDGCLDVEQEIRAVIAAFKTLVAQRRVRLEVAVQPGLLVRMNRQRLHELLGAMLTHAIHGVAGGRVLIGAMMHAGRVQIAVIDQDTTANRASQLADLQQAMQMAAMQGASLELDMRPSEGNTLLLRLLAS